MHSTYVWNVFDKLAIAERVAWWRDGRLPVKGKQLHWEVQLLHKAVGVLHLRIDCVQWLFGTVNVHTLCLPLWRL